MNAPGRKKRKSPVAGSRESLASWEMFLPVFFGPGMNTFDIAPTKSGPDDGIFRIDRLWHAMPFRFYGGGIGRWGRNSGPSSQRTMKALAFERSQTFSKAIGTEGNASLLFRLPSHLEARAVRGESRRQRFLRPAAADHDDFLHVAAKRADRS